MTYYTAPRDTDGHDFADNDDIKATRIVNSQSVLVGKELTGMSAFMKRIGNPSGNLIFGVYNADGSLAKSWMSLSMSSVATSSTEYTTTYTSGDEYTISNGQSVGVRYDGSSPDSSNYIRIMSGYSNVTTPSGSFDNTYQAFSTWDDSDGQWEDTDTTLALAGYINTSSPTPSTSDVLLPPEPAMVRL